MNPSNLRILRKYTRQYDAARDSQYFKYEDRLQYLVETGKHGDAYTAWEWHDIPIVIEETPTEILEKK